MRVDDGTDLMDEPVVRLTIAPEPSADERDAVVAALMAVLTVSGASVAAAEEPIRVSRWARAGRLAAVRGIGGGARQGWGRRIPS